VVHGNLGRIRHHCTGQRKPLWPIAVPIESHNTRIPGPTHWILMWFLSKFPEFFELLAYKPFLHSNLCFFFFQRLLPATLHSMVTQVTLLCQGVGVPWHADFNMVPGRRITEGVNPSCPVIGFWADMNGYLSSSPSEDCLLTWHNVAYDLEFWSSFLLEML
jgi:hypothetical protein